MSEQQQSGLSAYEQDYRSVGRIVSVTGSQVVVLLDPEVTMPTSPRQIRPEMGTVLRVEIGQSLVFGLVSGLSILAPGQNDDDSHEIWIAELELVGELRKALSGDKFRFSRGVSVYPSLGDQVYVARSSELELVYCTNVENAVEIGRLTQDSRLPAMVRVDELLGKHFAILGTTGTGKSCTVALIFQTILRHNPQAHILLLDPHNEYASAFPGAAEVVSPADLQLPYWFLTFEELVEVVIGDKPGCEFQIEILAELIPVAKGIYTASKNTQVNVRRGTSETMGHSVDTPVPYRMSDLMRLLDERMGKLENKKDVWSYRQLKHRIDSLMQDPRYGFMFGSMAMQDFMADVLGRLFRIPVNDKPITILQLTGLPSEVVNVVVSVLCRMTFDFSLWSEGMIPITLVCEEAHRYIPSDPTLGFEPTRRSIARIAKEGRKYGVSLCIVSQRPSELDQTILSQCNTVFAMRMANEADQNIVKAAVSDAGSGLLEFLPALGTREAIAFGDGMTLPARLKLNELPQDAMPKGHTASFSEKWQQKIGNKKFLDAVVDRWRSAGARFMVEDEPEPRMEARQMDLGASFRGIAPTSPKK